MTLRAGLEAWAHRQWAHRGLVACALSPLSLLFRAISRSRQNRTVPNRLPVPVVVVGNIYVGGTGKTPVTIALVRELQARGWHPGVISRGFGPVSYTHLTLPTNSKMCRSRWSPYH